MIMNGYERIMALLDGRQPDCLPAMPITMMFAADHAEFRYRDYATDYRVLAEAQLRVAQDYDFDHVSCISDPAREAADCGAVVQFFDDEPPSTDEAQALLVDKTSLTTLKTPDPLGGGRMTDRVQAAALFRDRIGGQRMIEGWVEGPCAEAADLRGINALMLDFFDDPPFVHDLFAFSVDLALRFGRAQVEAGVDIIGVGDAAASLVGPDLYEEFVWPYEKQLVDGLHALGTRVRLHICGNTSRLLHGMGRLGCDIVDLDAPASLSAARAAMGPRQVLLGNINPVAVLRDGSAATVRAAIAECHRRAGDPYIVGAGCEIPRGTLPANVRALIDYARSPIYPG